jgi:hypothetical protein
MSKEKIKEKSKVFLSGDEGKGLLASVLDEIIPRSTDGKFPGAGELGVADHIEKTLTQQPELGPLVAQGLSTISAVARSRNPEGFSALSREDRTSVLREVSEKNPAFFGILMLSTYAGYYTDRTVVERLGLRPHPQPDGYELEAGDLDTLLQKVRQRSEKLYREC